MNSQVNQVDFVQAGVLAPYLRVLGERGVPLEGLFSSCHIPVEAITRAEVWLPKTQVYTFAERAADFARLPGLGAIAGQFLRMDELGSFGGVIANAATLGEAGHAARRAIGLVASGADCWIEVRGPDAWFCYQPKQRFEPGGAQAEQFDLAMLLKFVRLAAGPAWCPEKIRVVSCSLGELRMIPDFVDVEIVRDAKVTAIGFPSRMLSQSMAPAFEGQIHSGGPVPHGGSLACAIASVVESLQPYAPTPSLIAMAEILGMHPRYLQRRLANEGCRYTEVVKQVRFKIACRLLRAGELSIKQIAEELNYSGTNNFTRSFRSLAGVPPSSFQKKNAG